MKNNNLVKINHDIKGYLFAWYEEEEGRWVDFFGDWYREMPDGKWAVCYHNETAMEYYDTAEECYRFLNKIRGGDDY